ncbi:MAG: hypothetical protein AAGH15_13780 [Myxococcota bacterium]
MSEEPQRRGLAKRASARRPQPRRTRVLAAAALASATCLLALSLAPPADAQRRRGRPARVEAPTSDAIAPALGDVEWGWSTSEFLEHFEAKIRDTYRPRIAKARDALQEDALRRQMRQEVRRMRESRYAFNGRTSGHDSGVLRDEFTHNHGESMIRVRTENADDFYFFIRDELWKWYRAFDARVFQGADFSAFKDALEGRFGAGLVRRGQLHEAAEEREWIEWQDPRTRLRAVDNTTFYGFYCLVFESRDTLGRLSQLRRNRPRGRGGSHPLVDSVTRDDAQEAGDGHHADIIDRITGNDRRDD